MKLKKGDYVTRCSYKHDTVFKITNIKDGVIYLKGVEARLSADAYEDDLILVDDYVFDTSIDAKEDDLDRSNFTIDDMDESLFFKLIPKVIHLDSDSEYLERCLKYYKTKGVYAIGKRIKEDVMHEQIVYLLNEYKPDIIVITGHDAYYRKKGDQNNIRNYKNTASFIKAVKAARSVERSHEKLVVIAGACQSYYEELIKAGANFASSPKRVNIHALDPAIIASTIALTEINNEIDLIKTLSSTKYGIDGMGGLRTSGLMHIGYPR